MTNHLSFFAYIQVGNYNVREILTFLRQHTKFREKEEKDREEKENKMLPRLLRSNDFKVCDCFFLKANKVHTLNLSLILTYTLSEFRLAAIDRLLIFPHILQ